MFGRIDLGFFLGGLLAFTTSLGILIHVWVYQMSRTVFVLVLAAARLAMPATTLGRLLVGLRCHLEDLRQGLALVRAHRLLHVHHPRRALAARLRTLNMHRTILATIYRSTVRHFY